MKVKYLIPLIVLLVVTLTAESCDERVDRYTKEFNDPYTFCVTTAWCGGVREAKFYEENEDNLAEGTPIKPLVIDFASDYLTPTPVSTPIIVSPINPATSAQEPSYSLCVPRLEKICDWGGCEYEFNWDCD